MKLYYIAVCILITGVTSKCKRCFPSDFMWGTATSAYQIEGAWNASGKGENMWDWFSHTYPEKILNQDNGDVACNSYNKYAEDVDLLNNLGVDFYRFSLSWSRILPDGTINNINQEGVDYYLNIFKTNFSASQKMSEKSDESDMELDNTPPEITNIANSISVLFVRGENIVCYSVRMKIRYSWFFYWDRIFIPTSLQNLLLALRDGAILVPIFALLKEKNIEPVVTLYHWDLPIKLHQLGGWSNPVIADFFADYASLCFERFGQYVKYWVTLNEPISQCYYGYGLGVHAPGYSQSGTLTYECAQTQLLAHAKAYRAYNETYKATQNGIVGIVLVSIWYEPLTNSTEDIEAAKNAFEWLYGLFANPIYNGNWPQVIIDRVGNLSEAQGFARSRLPSFTDEEIVLIKGTHDFLGFNYYTTYYASPMTTLAAIENTTVNFEVDKGTAASVSSSWPQSESTWLYDVPTGIRSMLKHVSSAYGNPAILITENGWSTGLMELNDTSRIEYLQGHLCNVLKAKLIDGVNVIGYTQWSLMDNFEWQSGYTEGFGLVAVDFESSNRTRTPKLSYYWYQDVTKSGCLETCKFRD